MPAGSRHTASARTAASATGGCGRRRPATTQTGSASMPRALSGTPTWATSTACGCARAARCWPRSTWTVAPSPARSAGARTRTCSSSARTSADPSRRSPAGGSWRSRRPEALTRGFGRRPRSGLAGAAGDHDGRELTHPLPPSPPSWYSPAHPIPLRSHATADARDADVAAASAPETDRRAWPAHRRPQRGIAGMRGLWLLGEDQLRRTDPGDPRPATRVAGNSLLIAAQDAGLPPDRGPVTASAPSSSGPGPACPAPGRSAAAVVALGEDPGPHACQHGIDIAALPSGLVQDQAGQPQRRHHRVSTPREAEMKHVMRGPRTLVVPRVDGFGVSQAVQDLIERFRLPPVSAPASHLLPAFLPRQLPTAISAAPAYGRDLQHR